MGFIYISIPITGKDGKEQRKKAEEIQSIFGKENALNPFELSELLETTFQQCGLGDPSYKDYLLNDISYLKHCDAILLCDGWEKSPGCRAEKAFAEAIGLKIIYQ